MNSKTNGFGLAEALIAIGIVSAIITGIIQQSKNLASIERLDKNQEFKKLLQIKIESILANESNCIANFEISDGNIKLKNSNSFVFWNNGSLEKLIDLNKENETNSIYKISKLSVAKNRFGFNELLVHILYKKYKRYITSKPIKVAILVKDGIIKKCSTSYERQINTIINTAVLKSCKGPFTSPITQVDDLSYKCSITTINPLYKSHCQQGTRLKSISLINDSGQLKYQGQCQPVTSCTDQSIGIFKNKQVICKKKCLPSELAIITNDGIKCVDINCPHGKYLQGIGADGHPVCKTLVHNFSNNCKNKVKIINNGDSVGVKCI